MPEKTQKAALLMNPLQVGLSDLYEHSRKVQEGRMLSDTGDTAWEPPTLFTRDTTKFWLRPRDVMRFKIELIKHLPLLIFSQRDKLLPGELGAEPRPCCPWYLIVLEPITRRKQCCGKARSSAADSDGLVANKQRLL